MAHRVFVLLLGVIVLTAVSTGGQPREERGENLVLITLDGARIEEMFGGLDLDVLKSTLKDPAKVEETRSYQRFWANTPEARRRKLLPFFWRLVEEHGSIAGDARTGSAVRLGNKHWFSYPGYAEILLGEAHDDVIKSNDPIRNPYATVLEAIRERHGLPREKVATFASWGVFRYIVEHNEGATLVNAGPTPLEQAPFEQAPLDQAPLDRAGDHVALLNLLQREAATPWDSMRFDAFTFRHAMGYLARARPRVLYLALGETDDWAHEGRYELVLDAFARFDAYLEELWTWLQAQPDYRGKTHVLITTDHGRGHTPADWRDHGARVKGADEVWIAFASPRTSQRGPWRNHAPLSTSQIAATLGDWMDVDWKKSNPGAGSPIK